MFNPIDVSIFFSVSGCVDMDPNALLCSGACNAVKDGTVHDIHFCILLYWYFQQNQCLNIKKQAVHNIHILSWGPILVGSRATAQHAHALRRH
jgi:hypothetical protein